jgi:hypothetical protein
LWKYLVIDVIRPLYHKTNAGFMENLAIHAGINRGTSAAVKTHFPDLKPALLPSYSLTITPEELSG